MALDLDQTRAAIGRFLRAVETGDASATASCFTVDGTWSNMPHPPAVGHEAIRALFARVLDRSSSVRWDVVSEAYAPGRAWLERVDRFWIDGLEHSVACNGVFEIDEATGLLREVRDYVDLGPWRAGLEAAGI